MEVSHWSPDVALLCPHWWFWIPNHPSRLMCTPYFMILEQNASIASWVLVQTAGMASQRLGLSASMISKKARRSLNE